MKKVIAISLILLILFNTLGFYGVFLGLGYKATNDLVQRLDNDDYRHEETVTFKVPLSIPYNVDGKDYERVNGEIEQQGDIYRLVKQKLAQDTLYIVCMKDVKSKRIRQGLSDYVKSFTDQPINTKSQGKIQVTFIKDFMLSSFSISEGIEGWNQSLALNNLTVLFFGTCANSYTGPPPKA